MALPTANLKAYWLRNSQSTFKDYVSGNDFIQATTADQVAPTAGTNSLPAMNFTGAGDFYDTSSAVIDLSSDFSIVIYGLTKGFGTTRNVMISFANSTRALFTWQSGFNADAIFETYNGGGYTYYTSSGTDFYIDNSVQLMILTRSGNTLTLYNGCNIITQNIDHTVLNTAAGETPDRLRIGKAQTSGNGGFTKAEIASIQLYDTALTQNQCKELNQLFRRFQGFSGITKYYSVGKVNANSAFTDILGNNSATAVNAGTLVSTAPNAQNCIQFDGTNDRYAYSDFGENDELTFSLWTYFDVWQEAGKARNVFGTDIGANDGIYLQNETGQSSLRLYIGDGSGVSNQAANITSDDVLQKWAKITIKYKRSTKYCEVWLNGVRVTAYTSARTVETTWLSDFNLGTGYSTDAIRHFSGKIWRPVVKLTWENDIETVFNYHNERRIRE